ncbi:MAG: glycosyltransferase family 4 protein [Lachnospiraceae bacterium]|jgi:1,2-diacylglycerol-3-alpha-glucose alpha-1,2-glucosyltransferase|nr:glycosyltransferase family 4 protein [Lachnospiraceae bacterium]
MKVLLYSGSQHLIERSGVGRAIYHQKEALSQNQVEYTMDVKDNWDIVHINTIFPASFLLSRRARRQGKKVVYHGHSTEEDFRNSFVGSNLVAPLFRKWLTLCYSQGDVIVAPTPYAKKLIDNYHTGRPVVSISNGIDLSFYQRDEAAGRAFREKYGFTAEDKVVLSVGLPIDRKGILDFVELARQLPAYQFVWFGDLNLPMLPPHIREALKTELPNLHFPGYIRKEELRDAYSGSDVFLFLTKEETEGIVLLEALAMKCPVLVRDIPIYEDWLTDGRQVSKASTVEGFAGKLTSILEGELRERLPQMLEAGYETARERSISSVGWQLAREYRHLMEPVAVPMELGKKKQAHGLGRKEVLAFLKVPMNFKNG